MFDGESVLYTAPPLINPRGFRGPGRSHDRGPAAAVEKARRESGSRSEAGGRTRIVLEADAQESPIGASAAPPSIANGARVYEACGGSRPRTSIATRRARGGSSPHAPSSTRGLGETQAALATTLAEDITALARAEERREPLGRNGGPGAGGARRMRPRPRDLCADRCRSSSDGEETGTQQESGTPRPRRPPRPPPRPPAGGKARDEAARALAIAQTDARNCRGDRRRLPRRSTQLADTTLAAALAARALPREGGARAARDPARGTRRAPHAADGRRRRPARGRLGRSSHLRDRARGGHPPPARPGGGYPALEGTAHGARRGARRALRGGGREARRAPAGRRRPRPKAGALAGEIAAAEEVARLWGEVNDAIGSADGLEVPPLRPVRDPRSPGGARQPPPSRRSRRATGSSVPAARAEIWALQILDRDLGDERRSTRSLSGGERFLTSLALALALLLARGPRLLRRHAVHRRGLRHARRADARTWPSMRWRRSNRRGAGRRHQATSSRLHQAHS